MAMSRESSCHFCAIAGHHAPASILYENEQAMAFLDLFPATMGHALVIPKGHWEGLYELPEQIAGEVMAAAVVVAQGIKRVLSPAGLNLIHATGPAAGQTVPHLHLHLVPRYQGDGVTLRFGHGSVSADRRKLDRLAGDIRSAFD